MSWWDRIRRFFTGDESETGVASPSGSFGDDEHSQVQPVSDSVVRDGPAHSLAMPYDEHLLERVRNWWQLGECADIALLVHADVAAHPARGLIAAYVAAAHEQMEERDLARDWYLRARDWGCPQRKLAEIMLSNLHVTFAQTKLMLGDDEAALSELESAGQLDNSGSRNDRVLQLRMDALRETHKLPELAGASVMSVADASTTASQRPAVSAKTATSGTPEGTQVNRAQTEVDVNIHISKTVGKLADQLMRSVRDLRSDLTNVTRQIESHAELQSFLRDEQGLPSLHGWPVSPDIAAIMVRMIEQRDLAAVVEFGSGSSTFLMATALLRKVRGGNDRPTALLSFDHLSSYRDATCQLLARLESSTHVSVEYAPLVPMACSDGLSYLYYDCAAALDALAAGVAQQATLKPVLVFVDGPPGATGRHARFPALDCILTAFSRNPLLLMLDDYARPEEIEVANLWMKRLEAVGRPFRKTVFKLEKDAILIEVDGVADDTA